MNQETIYQGGCNCGQARYRVEGYPMIVHCCHCRWCQRETGAAFVINGLIERSRIELISGELKTIHLPSFSGQGQKVHQCSICRVNLWSHFAFAGIGEQVAFLRVSTLDDSAAMQPDVHIYTESKIPWLSIKGPAKILPGYYRTRDLWSAESLARKAALLPQVEQQSI